MSLMKSRQRVADHGEVFTSPEVVDGMLALVREEVERIDSRILEPACGSGNFLVPILARKLSTVDARYGRNDFEKRHHALLALMSIYGVELLVDNVAECRDNLLQMFVDVVGVSPEDELCAAALNVLATNIVHGDAISMTTRDTPVRQIMFAEWSYLGKGKFYRRDFRFDTLAKRSSFGKEYTLFAGPSNSDLFEPTRDFGSMSIAGIAQGVEVDD